MVTIDLDIGGTFTDCVAIREGRIIRQKTPTTRHNLSIGLKRAISAVAQELKMSLGELLAETSSVRYSTTLAMNTLIERSGPKLGLITTAGFEHTTLIGRARQWADGLHPTEARNMAKIARPVPLIEPDLIVGVKERIDCFGNVIIPLKDKEVREKLQYLVDQGARGFVVCLLWAFLNPCHEQRVKAIVQEEYPDHYLGNMPIMLSSEVQPKIHEYPRVNVTILNAYLQTEMTDQLSSLSMELRTEGYERPLTIINNIGGTGKISRTRAVDTYGAGPVAGLFGAAHISKLYGHRKVIVSDMGGTSFDYGLVLSGMPNSYQSWPVIDRWATETSMVEVKTIGAGGGSIAKLNKALGNRLEVGPRSASSNPGPACYSLGGTEPTVTDADVVLGYINPHNFLGGKIKLNRDRALRSMEKVAKPLGLNEIEAAAAIRAVVDANMGNTIKKEILLKGHNPKEFTLYAYGGAGPTHCTSYGAYVGSESIVTFSYASVFCAMGGATLDVRHIYERSKRIILSNRNGLVDCVEDFNWQVQRLKEIAIRDMRTEGFSLEQVEFSLEIEARYGSQINITRARSPLVELTSLDDTGLVVSSFNQQYRAKFGDISATPELGVSVETFYLIASVRLPKPDFRRYELQSTDPTAALDSQRPVYWPEFGGFKDTNVYDYSLLQPGNVIEGPAIIEARDTTYVISPGKRFNIDSYLNGIIS